ncbi:CobW/P47K family protein [Brevibacterium mcbrellneri ATCC 49030]|uniref:CobW/P47K family protein n=1 Tax=Brevibacterium mcbrellneri ATCC 49030 TaxID=585530 RepID=D4YJA6_9MICO|nr:GTP-binding protein [Brevibacterium mcbrellneri]EFG48717.1 CobW/P47K family protein [Brevibacterium mcbrellneri ATCC 49030]
MTHTNQGHDSRSGTPAGTPADPTPTNTSAGSLAETPATSPTSANLTHVRSPVPVILLTGYLGAGKTSVLNNLLRHPSARVGVIVNDFGELNIDAGLISNQVNEPVAISGGCICCLTDAGGLEDALAAMAAPKHQLDAIVVEASGFAEPLTLARLVSRWGRGRFRLGGVIDVIDACEHFSTVDQGGIPPLRYAVATLVLVNKLDLIPPDQRDAHMSKIRDRVHSRNPRAHVVSTVLGRIDPHLLFDGSPEPSTKTPTTSAGETNPANPEWQQTELPLHDLFMASYRERDEARLASIDAPSHDHTHAHSVTVEVPGAVNAEVILNFLEDLPPGAYRAKGFVTVPTGRGTQAFVVQAVGPNVFASRAKDTVAGSALVVIGADLDEHTAEVATRTALAELTADGPASPGLERLRTLVRLHS